MARTAKPIQQSELQGLKYFSMLDELLKKLRHVGTERDKAGNRELSCDRYVSLLLLYFFSPVITSMRTLQEASELENVQKILGIKRVSLGSYGSRVSRRLAVSSHHRRQVVVHCAGQRQHCVCGQRGTFRNRGSASSGRQDEVQQSQRLVVVGTTNDEGQPIELWLVTDCLDLAAEHVAVGYRYRSTVELLFRWFKRILDCRHLISTKENGVTMPLYAALIATMLIVLWTGLKANKRTWEMLQFYFRGWATEAELERHIHRQKERQLRAAKINRQAQGQSLSRKFDRPRRTSAPSSEPIASSTA